MKLTDTSFMMYSDDFKTRFKAEYLQLKLRLECITKMLEGLKNNTLSFKPKCSYEILNEQVQCMSGYFSVLEKRAEIENIDLTEDTDLMSIKEISNMFNCINLMVSDLNEIYNNYDVDTQTKLNYETEIRNTIKEFNKAQSIWCIKLIPCLKGWEIRYE